eukprot:g8895.t1
MSDLRDMLGLAKGGFSQGGQSKRGGNATSKAKLGSRATSKISTAPTYTYRGKKGGLENSVQGRVLPSAAAKVTWLWKPFQISARGDKSNLSHWTASHTPTAADYQFSRFNEKCAVVVPTEEETSEVPESAEWKGEDTKLLLELCQKYDLRWPLIHDRWAGSTDRSEEELKTRYFDTAQAILKYRFDRFEPGRRGAIDSVPLTTSDKTTIEVPQPKGENARNLLDLKWDGQKERERVAAAAAALSQTKHDEVESKRLRELSKKLDIQIRKLKREHVNPSGNSATSASSKGLRPPMPALPRPTVGPAAIFSTDDRNTYLRSWRLANVGAGQYFGPRIVSKMSKVLGELSVPAHPLPTQRVCDAYDQLRQDILNLIEAQKELKSSTTVPRKTVSRKIPPEEKIKIAELNKPSSSSLLDGQQSAGATDPIASTSFSNESIPNKKRGKKRKLEQRALEEERVVQQLKKQLEGKVSAESLDWLPRTATAQKYIKNQALSETGDVLSLQAIDKLVKGDKTVQQRTTEIKRAIKDRLILSERSKLGEKWVEYSINATVPGGSTFGLGAEFSPMVHPTGILIKKFVKIPGGEKGALEVTGKVAVGDVIVSINGAKVAAGNIHTAMMTLSMIAQYGRSLEGENGLLRERPELPEMYDLYDISDKF